MSDDEESNVKCPPPGAPLWLATFADLMSLLMCFFVLLLAFSEMDVLKFKQLSGSMREAFGVQREIKAKATPKGTSVIAREFSPGKPTPTVLKIIRQQTTNDMKRNMDFRRGKRITRDDAKKESGVGDKARNFAKENEIAKKKAEEKKKAIAKIKNELKNEITKGQVQIVGKPGRIVIRIREKGSFPSGSDRMSSTFASAMKKIALVVKKSKGRILISGHTDNIPISTFRFKSNWELSSSRAVSVLREIQRYEKINNSRLAIQGHADTIPLVPNNTRANRAKNRRVEVSIVYGEDQNKETSLLDLINKPGKEK